MSLENRPVEPFRTIITSHHPDDIDGTHVELHDTLIAPKPVLGGLAHIHALYSHSNNPTISSHSLTSTQLTESQDAAPNVVFPGGTNGRVTDLAPGAMVGYHRTSSVDYNIFISGSCELITPLPDGKEERTLCKAGDIVIQRGTLHAWKAGEEGARWYSVIVAAEPVKVGDKEGKELVDVDF